VRPIDLEKKRTAIFFRKESKMSFNLLKYKRLAFLLMLFTLVLSLLWFSIAFAQENDPDYPSDDQVNAIARQLYCPVCENVPLDVCGTQACAQWRALIREKLVDGWTEEQIKEYFSNQYGDRVLSEPPARGLNWLVYIIPPLVFFAGAFFLYRGFVAWKQLGDEDGSSESQTEPEIDDPYLARLEEELNNQ
jgi:cytochrome c-type biogenesis protein CcmH